MHFDLQPTLKGNLITLRPLREDDFASLYAVASDPLIWEQHPQHDRYKEEVFRVFFKEAMESGGALLVTDNRDNKVIGSSRFHGYDEALKQIEIGWSFLARSHWGSTYNHEMKDLMLRHAFQFVESVIFLIGPYNLRSQCAIERIGAKRIGYSKDSKGATCVVYRINASEFKSRSC